MISQISSELGSTIACAISTLFLIYTVSSTRSLVLTETAWLSAFATSILGISTFDDSFKKGKNLEKLVFLFNYVKILLFFSFTYGLVRLPVVLVFSSLILVQLSSVFILKESLETLLAAHGHHHSGLF